MILLDNNNQGTGGDNPAGPNTGGMGQSGMDMSAAPSTTSGDVSVPTTPPQDSGVGLPVTPPSDPAIGGGMPQTPPSPMEPMHNPDSNTGGMGTGMGAPAAEPATPVADPSQPMQGGAEMPPAAPATDGSQNPGGENPTGENPGGTPGV